MRVHKGAIPKSFFAFCFLVFSPCVAQAQPEKTFAVTGMVQDPSGSAIVQAWIQLLDARQFAVSATRTDDGGKFRFQDVAGGSYELIISAWGFSDRRVAISLPSADASSLNLVLGPSSPKTTVTVTADIGLVQDTDQTTQRVNVIDEQQLADRAKSVLAQAAQEEVGLQLQRTSPTIGAIFVRGLTGAKVVTYVDGIRFSTAAMRGGINSFFNLVEPGNLRAMEVLRGPNSAQYGSDSLGGAVQLVSRGLTFAAETPRFSQRLGTYFNSADLGFGGTAAASYSRRDFSLLLNLNSSRHSTIRPGGGIDTHAAVARFLGMRSDIWGDRMTDTAFTQYGGQIRLAFKPSAIQQITFHYERSQQDGGKRYDQTLGGDGNLIADLRNFMLDFFYARYERLNAGWLDSFAASYSMNTQREERVNQGGNGNPNASITHQKERTWDHGLQIQAAKRWGSSHNLALGGEFYHDAARAPAYTLNPVAQVSVPSRPRIPDGSEYGSGGIYVQEIWQAVPKRLRLTGALRAGFASYRSLAANSPLVGGKPLWPDDSLSVCSLTPRFGALLTLSGGFGFSTQVSRGFRAPHITDLGTLGLTGNGYEVPYADVAGRNAMIGSTADITAISTGKSVQQLVPETSWSYEGSLHYRRNRIDFDLTGFVHDITDNISVQSLILPPGAVGTYLGDQVITGQTAAGAVFVEASSNPVLIRSNYDQARIFGIEQTLDLQLSQSLNLNNTFTYIHAEDRRTGLPPNIEGGTPAPQGWVKLHFQPTGRRYWVEPYVYAANRQERLSSLDLSDRRTGAARSRTNIRSFFLNGASVRGLVGPGPDGKPGTSDDILISTGESLAQVQNRVLGPGVVSAPLFRAIPGFLTLNIRGGLRLGERHDLVIDFENIADRNYRGISWGLDAPGRSIAVRYSLRF